MPGEVGGVSVEGRREFDDLFLLEFPAVVRTVYLISGDWQTAQDATQEAFLQALRHWPRVQDLERPGAWVRRVAIREALKAVRRDRTRRIAEATVAGPSLEMDTTVADLFSAIRLLTHHQRVAVVMFYYERASLEEIAHLLGCSASTAGVHLHRARVHLAEQLKEVDSDGPR